MQAVLEISNHGKLRKFSLKLLTFKILYKCFNQKIADFFSLFAYIEIFVMYLNTVLKKMHYSCYVNAKQQMVFEEKASGI